MKKRYVVYLTLHECDQPEGLVNPGQQHTFCVDQQTHNLNIQAARL